jgi:uncharacterized damage-inducible protein DinB
VHRAVLHALELAREDITRCCGDLTAEELNDRPRGLASVGFHLLHTARSVDRLLTYAEGRQLEDAQLTALNTELDTNGTPEQLFTEFYSGLTDGARRVRALSGSNLETTRTVGRRRLPTSLGGLLVHVAEHTQRHVGQAITTAKIVRRAKGVD